MRRQAEAARRLGDADAEIKGTATVSTTSKIRGRHSEANGHVDQVIGCSRSGGIIKFNALNYVIGRLSEQVLVQRRDGGARVARMSRPDAEPA